MQELRLTFSLGQVLNIKYENNFGLKKKLGDVLPMSGVVTEPLVIYCDYNFNYHLQLPQLQLQPLL